MNEAAELIIKAASILSKVTDALKKEMEVDNSLKLLKEANFISDEEDLDKYKKELQKYPTESIGLIAKGWAQSSVLNKTANDWGVPISSAKSLDYDKNDREDTFHNKIMSM